MKRQLCKNPGQADIPGRGLSDPKVIVWNKPDTARKASVARSVEIDGIIAGIEVGRARSSRWGLAGFGAIRSELDFKREWIIRR